MRRRRILLLCVLAFAPIVWLGCNAILGNDDARFVPSNSEGGDDGRSDTAGGDGDTDGNATDGGGDAPITCDADLANDPLHCGACTRDCFGGACEAGACSPVLVATDPSTIRELAVDGTNVYWENSIPEIRKHAMLASDGGTGDLVYAGVAPAYFSGIAVSGGRVYFGVGQVSDAGSIGSCDTNACLGGPQDHAATIAPATIVISGGTLVWSNEIFTGSVSACTLPACATPVAIASPEKFPSTIVVDKGEVLWSSSIGHSIHGAPLTGGTGLSRSIVEDGGQVFGVAASGDHVYYAKLATGIAVGPRDGGVPSLFTSAAPQAHDVAADATNVYFADSQQGTLYRCPTASCASVTTLATVPGSTVGVVLDATSVYWIAQSTVGASSIWRIAK